MELTRKTIENIIELHEMGKDTEQIMFSIGMEYEPSEDEEETEE
jgi:hypothetical protein